jgi:hypothetical protein
MVTLTEPRVLAGDFLPNRGGVLVPEILKNELTDVPPVKDLLKRVLEIGDGCKVR